MTDFQQKIPKKHVLFLAFPAFGHIIPTLELAKKTSQFHEVTFVVSLSISEGLVKRELISNDDPESNFHILELDDGVVAEFDTSVTPGLDQVNRFISKMQPAFHALLRSMPVNPSHHFRAGESRDVQFSESLIKKPVDVVIAESFMTSIALSVCHDLSVPCCIFNATSGSSLANGLNVTEDTPAVPDNGPVIAGKRALTETVKKFLIGANGNINLASAVIINTFIECDRRGKDGLKAHPKTKNIPVFCVGPIFSSEAKPKPESGKSVIENFVRKFLDRQKNRSVIYVSFGSIAALSPAQTEILGKTLLSMKKPFIYSISESLQTALPEEIRKNIEFQFKKYENSFLVLPWVPQKVILKHPSVGVFFTHAGWNSTIESILGGVPMVAWPMFAEQHENSNWIVEKGIGTLIPGTKFIGSRFVPEEELTEAIEQAEKCQKKSEELAEEAERALAEGGSSHQDFMRLIKFEFLLSPRLSV